MSLVHTLGSRLPLITQNPEPWQIIPTQALISTQNPKPCHIHLESSGWIRLRAHLATGGLDAGLLLRTPCVVFWPKPFLQQAFHLA